MSDAPTPAPPAQPAPVTSAEPPAKRLPLVPILLFQIAVTAGLGAFVFTQVRGGAAQAAHVEAGAEGAPPEAGAAGHGAPRDGRHEKGKGGLSDDLAWGAGGPEIWHELAAGNQRFATGHPKQRDLVDRRAGVAAGQHPPAMVLACSDSRVPPELLLDQGLGDLFVVRTAGNVADSIAIASLEYAAEHLGSRLLVVLGHERCGAVTAAVNGGPMPSRHLQALVDEIAPAVEPLRAGASGDQLVQRSVEANALREARKLEAESAILKELIEKHQLQILAAVYDLDSGKVREVGEVGAQAAAPGAAPPGHEPAPGHQPAQAQVVAHH